MAGQDSKGNSQPTATSESVPSPGAMFPPATTSDFAPIANYPYNYNSSGAAVNSLYYNNTLRAGNAVVAAPFAQAAVAFIGGLVRDTSYDIYLVLDDNGYASSNYTYNERLVGAVADTIPAVPWAHSFTRVPVRLSVHTTDVTPPEWQTNYPQVADLRSDHFTLKLRADTLATAYYIVTDFNSQWPTADQVRGGPLL